MQLNNDPKHTNPQQNAWKRKELRCSCGSARHQPDWNTVPGPKRAVHKEMLANLNELMQDYKEEWFKIAPQWQERLKKGYTENKYIGLLLLRYGLYFSQDSESESEFWLQDSFTGLQSPVKTFFSTWPCAQMHSAYALNTLKYLYLS